MIDKCIKYLVISLTRNVQDLWEEKLETLLSQLVTEEDLNEDVTCS